MSNRFFRLPLFRFRIDKPQHLIGAIKIDARLAALVLGIQTRADTNGVGDCGAGEAGASAFGFDVGHRVGLGLAEHGGGEKSGVVITFCRFCAPPARGKAHGSRRQSVKWRSEKKNRNASKYSLPELKEKSQVN